MIPIDRLPISDYMKEYYREQNFTFTDSECATIIWNSDLDKTDKLFMLSEICSETFDMKLKKEIEERLKYESENAEDFDRSYVYICVLDGHEKSRRERHFSTPEAAVKYGEQQCTEFFEIKKVCLSESCKYSKQGEIISPVNAVPSDIISLDDLDSSRFENSFVYQKNPFKRGDIVMIDGNTRPAVAEGFEDDWDYIQERLKTLNSGFRNSRTSVYFLEDNGVLSHRFVPILNMRKIDSWDIEIEWDILTALSLLLQGKGFLDDFLCFLQENNKERGYKDFEIIHTLGKCVDEEDCWTGYPREAIEQDYRDKIKDWNIKE